MLDQPEGCVSTAIQAKCGDCHETFRVKLKLRHVADGHDNLERADAWMRPPFSVRRAANGLTS